MRRLPFVLLLCILALTSARAVAQRRGRAGGQARGGRPRGAYAGTAAVKHEVTDAKKKQAVCNDGSPAAFYFRQGRDPDRNKWIIFLQGGGGCGTDHDCRTRWADQHNLMTSEGLPMRREQDGLLSADEQENPDFARYSLAVVHYCSSDAYAGDGQRQLDGRTLQFRGRRIIDAVLDDLMDASIVGSQTLRQATEVLFAGTSAGGMGMHNNLDRVAARLSWARVKGLADSSWGAPLAPFGPGTLEVGPSDPSLVDYFNAQPDDSCAAANPTQKGRCLQEAFLYPYLTTPLFVYADQRDPVLLGVRGIVGPAGTAAERAYVDRYSQTIRDELKDLPAVFSPSINVHTSLATERFHSVLIDGHDLAETIGNWYFNRPGPTHLIASEPSDARTRGAGGRGAGRGAGRGR